MKTENAATSAYSQIFQAISHLVNHYRKDLEEHDKRDMEANPEIPFLHFAGDMGTHLVMLKPSGMYPPKGEKVPFCFGHADREWILVNGTRDVLEAIGRNYGHYIGHYWNGSTLKPVSHEQAAQIGEDHIKRIRREFQTI